MTPEDAIARILERLRVALEQIPLVVEALREEEVHGESAAGCVRVVYSPLGDLKRIEIDSLFLHDAGRRRVEEALLEAFREAEGAADAARADFEGDLTFMGIPVGRAMRNGSIAEILPPRENISELFED